MMVQTSELCARLSGSDEAARHRAIRVLLLRLRVQLRIAVRKRRRPRTAASWPSFPIALFSRASLTRACAKCCASASTGSRSSICAAISGAANALAWMAIRAVCSSRGFERQIENERVSESVNGGLPMGTGACGGSAGGGSGDGPGGRLATGGGLVRGRASFLAGPGFFPAGAGGEGTGRGRRLVGGGLVRGRGRRRWLRWRRGWRAGRIALRIGGMLSRRAARPLWMRCCWRHWRKRA